MIKCNEFVSISELSNVITLFWPKLCIYTPCVFIPVHIRNTVQQKKNCNICYLWRTGNVTCGAHSMLPVAHRELICGAQGMVTCGAQKYYLWRTGGQVHV